MSSEAAKEIRGKRSGRLVRQVLVRFTFLALLPISLILLVAFFDTRRALTDELIGKLRAVAARQAALVTRAIDNRFQDALMLANLSETLAALDKRSNSLTRFQDFERVAERLTDAQGIQRIYLISRDGEIVTSAGTGPQAAGNIREGPLKSSALSEVVEKAKSVLEVEVSFFGFHEFLDAPAGFVACPAIKDGLLVGVVVLQLETARDLGAMLDTTGLGRTGDTLVLSAIDENQVTLVAPTRFHPEAPFRFTVSRDSHPVLWGAVHGERGYGMIQNHLGQEVFAVWRYIPTVRWGLIVTMDPKEAFDPVERQAQTLGLLFGLTALLVLAAAYGSSRAVTQPVLELRNAAQDFTESQFRGELRAYPEPRNEIGELGSSVRNMADELKRLLAQLEEGKANLERKVLERTAELEQKNRQLQRTLQDLGEAQERMVAQARLASLGQLSKGVAHEIKNPLNFVNNFAIMSKELCNELREVIEDSRDIPGSVSEEAGSLIGMVQDNLDRIESHGKRADQIVSGMLEHSRASTSTEMQATDIVHAIRTSLEVACRLAGELAQKSRPKVEGTETVDFGLEQWITVEADPDTGQLQVYPGDFCRGLINIVSNAFWAVQQKLEKNPGDYKPDIRIRTSRKENLVQVEIRDNGIGMEPEILRQCLHPFFTTRPPGEGTGLGLSIAHNIFVELHGGSLEIHSQYFEGTTVTILVADHAVSE